MAVTPDPNVIPTPPPTPDPATPPGSGNPTPTPAHAPTPTPTPAPPTEPDLSKLTREEAIAFLDKERKDRAAANQEAKTAKDRLKVLEDAEKERKKAEMTDLEKAQADLKEANDRVAASTKLAQDTRIALEATKLGFIQPEDAATLLDRSKLKEDLSNVEDLLKDLKKAKPYLAGTARGNVPGNQFGNTPGGDANIPEEDTKKRAMSLFSTLRRRQPSQ